MHSSLLNLGFLRKNRLNLIATGQPWKSDLEFYCKLVVSFVYGTVNVAECFATAVSRVAGFFIRTVNI